MSLQLNELKTKNRVIEFLKCDLGAQSEHLSPGGTTGTQGQLIGSKYHNGHNGTPVSNFFFLMFGLKFFINTFKIKEKYKINTKQYINILNMFTGTLVTLCIDMQ